jgi:hypothetical protein
VVVGVDPRPYHGSGHVRLVISGYRVGILGLCPTCHTVRSIRSGSDFLVITFLLCWAGSDFFLVSVDG